jgi:hypothetical protein
MTEATTAIEVRALTRGLAINERYMGFVNYVYPMAVNWPAKHRVLRETLLKTMFGQIELFHLAAKSDQSSRLYAADAGLAVLREFLRFASDPARKLLSRHQHEVAEVHLAETGAMLGAWINKAQKGRSR